MAQTWWGENRKFSFFLKEACCCLFVYSWQSHPLPWQYFAIDGENPCFISFGSFTETHHQLPRHFSLINTPTTLWASWKLCSVVFSSVTKAHSAVEQTDSSFVHAEKRLEVSFLFQTTCQNNRFSKIAILWIFITVPSKETHNHIFQGPFLPSSASHFLPCSSLKPKWFMDF